MEEKYTGAIRFNKDLWFYVEINTRTFTANLKLITITPTGVDVEAVKTLTAEDWYITTIED